MIRNSPSNSPQSPFLKHSARLSKQNFKRSETITVTSLRCFCAHLLPSLLTILAETEPDLRLSILWQLTEAAPALPQLLRSGETARQLSKLASPSSSLSPPKPLLSLRNVISSLHFLIPHFNRILSISLPILFLICLKHFVQCFQDSFKSD